MQLLFRHASVAEISRGSSRNCAAAAGYSRRRELVCGMGKFVLERLRSCEVLTLGLLFALVLSPVTAKPAPSFVQNGSILTMSNVNVMVKYDLSLGSADFYWQNSKKMSRFYSGVGLSSGYVKGTNYTGWSYSLVASNQVAITATGNGHPTMKQYFTLDQDNSFLVRVEMDGTALSANWMGPVVVDAAGGVDIGTYADVRSLTVPFDNDHSVAYNAASINSSGVSYEAAAFYDNVTRNGLVVGSVTHDTWKGGVYWSGSGDKLNQMNVYGGLQCPWDVMPHGSVTGNTISSPTVFVGFETDWRTTMEDYANENTNMVPRRTWSGGVPFGWNSWYGIGTSISYNAALTVSDFIHSNLQTNNFNNNGQVYVNLDSYWDNLNASQLSGFASHCHANGQKAGIYWAPFVWWGAVTNATNSYVEGSSYRYSDIMLKTTGGAFQSNDGALALDPTHPGTKQRMDYYASLFLEYGFDYIKLDFLSHGALEGVHYDTNVTTGIQAYNEGMQYLIKDLGSQMFISESIAPIFPYQYAHSRRIACDTSTYISETSYEMQSVTYGWWINDRLYQYNDPDCMKFSGATTNENQSRLISCAVSGTVFLNSDDLTSSGNQFLAITCLTNAAINSVAQGAGTFKAAENNTGTNPANVFVGKNGTTWYVAIFNFSGSSLNTNVDLSRAGISGVFSAADLWSGDSTPITGTTFPVSLNGKQAKLLKLLNVPELQSPQMGSNGTFNCSLTGNAGSVYAIEATTNLAAWNTAATITNTSGTTRVTLASPPGQMNFYRAKFLH
jgi:hypothetical protein